MQFQRIFSASSAGLCKRSADAVQQRRKSLIWPARNGAFNAAGVRGAEGAARFSWAGVMTACANRFTGGRACADHVMVWRACRRAPAVASYDLTNHSQNTCACSPYRRLLAQQPEITPNPKIQETLDSALDRAPDRAKAQFALLVGEAEHGKRGDHMESFEVPGGSLLETSLDATNPEFGDSDIFSRSGAISGRSWHSITVRRGGSRQDVNQVFPRPSRPARHGTYILSWNVICNLLPASLPKLSAGSHTILRRMTSLAG